MTSPSLEDKYVAHPRSRFDPLKRSLLASKWFPSAFKIPMPAITYVSPSDEAYTIEVPLGDSVMEGAVQNGIDGILAECGGNLQCATCHVYVDEAFLGLLEPIKEDENEMLNVTASERKPNSRLSCQLQVTKKLDGLIVQLPPTQK